jgi:hypothetical protein
MFAIAITERGARGGGARRRRGGGFAVLGGIGIRNVFFARFLCLCYYQCLPQSTVHGCPRGFLPFLQLQHIQIANHSNFSLIKNYGKKHKDL